jgi:hypothetical protein
LGHIIHPVVKHQLFGKKGRSLVLRGSVPATVNHAKEQQAAERHRPATAVRQGQRRENKKR